MGIYHDPQPGSNGKGDRPRISDVKAFRAGMDRICGEHTRREGRSFYVNGRWIHEDDIATDHAKKVELARKQRVKDNVNIRSTASGVAVSQVAEATRRFGHLGVKFDPATGDAIYADRQAKLRVMKARGIHDRQETQGGPPS